MNCFVSMIESHENSLSQNSEQNEQNSGFEENNTSVINQLNESISQERKS